MKKKKKKIELYFAVTWPWTEPAEQRRRQRGAATFTPCDGHNVIG